MATEDFRSCPWGRFPELLPADGGNGVLKQPGPLISLEETQNSDLEKKITKDSRRKFLSNRSLHAESYLFLIFISSLIIRYNASDHTHLSSRSSHIRPSMPTPFCVVVFLEDPLSSICASHIILVVWPSTVALGENGFFSFQRLSIASSSSGRGGALCHLPARTCR